MAGNKLLYEEHGLDYDQQGGIVMMGFLKKEKKRNEGIFR